jgi:hypothetical protein
MPSGTRRRKVDSRGVSVSDTREILLELPDVSEGRSYGMPSFLLNGRFFARFRDDDTVLVLRLGSIGDRDVLMQIDPRVFFFTDHYKDHPAVLIHLADVPRPLLVDVLTDAWRHAAAKPPARRRQGSTRRSGKPRTPKPPR